MTENGTAVDHRLTAAALFDLMTRVDGVSTTATLVTGLHADVTDPERQHSSTVAVGTTEKSAAGYFDDCSAAIDFRSMSNYCWPGNGSSFDALFSSATAAAGGSHKFWTLLLLVFPVLTVFGNVLVVLGVYRERTLQSATNYFIVSLAIADIMVAILVMPLAVYVEVNESIWELGDALCDTWVALDVGCCTASILNLAAISVDRFIAVTQPIKYAKHQSSRRVHVMLALTWIISVAISSPIALGMNYTERRAKTPTLCTFYNSDFLIYSSMGSFYIPCVVMVLLYWRIFHTIRQRTRKSIAASAASAVSSDHAQRHRKSTLTTSVCVTKPEITRDGRKSMPTVASSTAIDNIVAVEPTVAAINGSDEAEPEPETGHLLLDMTSSAIEMRRRQRRRPRDETSSDADRETALIVQVNNDEIAQLSSDSCHNTDNASGMGVAGQRAGGYAGPTTATVETTSLSPPVDRLRHVTVTETPGGGQTDYLASDVTDNDVNNRRIESLKNNLTRAESSHQGPPSKLGQTTTTTTAATTTTKFSFSFHLPGRRRAKDRDTSSGSGGGLRNYGRPFTARAVSSAHRHERRATKTLAIVLGVFLFCWVPFFTLNIINATCIRYDLFQLSRFCRFDPILFSFFVWLGYINSFLNPVIYTIFNEEFRRAFKRLLCISR